MRELKVNMKNEFDGRYRPQVFRLATVLFALAMVASACGSDTDEGEAAAQQESADDPSGNDDTATPETNEASDGGPEIAISISWTSPEGMDPVGLAVSPDGARVAVGFASPLGLEAASAEVIVFDVASGEDIWRAPIEDAGLLGLGGMMFTTTGVSFYKADFEGTTIVTLSDGAVTAEIPIDSECAQFLNGTVHPTDNVAYTVVPGGFCRVDLNTGATTSIRSSDLSEGAELVDSISYGAAGDLVATFSDADFATVSLALDPTTMASTGPASGEPEPLGDLYRDRLAEGPALASGTRVAASPDRSVIALLQPDSIEVLG